MKHPQSIQISIPQPCHEDWNNMTPQQQGRFCDSCQKCVVDFTGFTDAQLYDFFKDYKGGVCGHFSAWQLTREVDAPHGMQKRIHRWLVSLGIVMFLTDVFSTESLAQGTSGTIGGKVFTENNQQFSNVLVQVVKDGIIKGSVRSNKDGQYVIKVQPGRYNLYFSYPGFVNNLTTEVLVGPENHTEVKARMRPCSELCDEVDSNKYVAPLININSRGNVAVKTSEELERMPARNTGQKKDGFFTRLWAKLF